MYEFLSCRSPYGLGKLNGDPIALCKTSVVFDLAICAETWLCLENKKEIGAISLGGFCYPIYQTELPAPLVVCFRLFLPEKKTASALMWAQMTTQKLGSLYAIYGKTYYKNKQINT